MKATFTKLVTQFKALPTYQKAIIIVVAVVIVWMIL